MRRMTGPSRVGVSRYATTAVYAASATVGRVGPAGLLLLSVLYWAIFYQNLPNDLDGMASNSPAVTANIAARIMKISMIGVSVYYLLTRWSLTQSLAKKANLGSVAFLLLALASALWSIDNSSTIFRFVSLLTIFLVGFAICVAGWHPRRFQQLAIPPLMLILLASLVLGIFAPDRVTEIGNDISQKGAWHGLTHSKNEFGMMSSIAAILCMNRWLSREGRTYWAMAGAATAFACLTLSRSNTSLLATAISVLFMMLVLRVPVTRQRFSTFMVVAIAVTLLLYELVVQDVLPGAHTLLAPVASLFGKDTTFSARSTIWAIVKEHMQFAPILGTGYGAYWVGALEENSPSHIFVALQFFYPTEAHNGYLDVMNDLGIVGLICLLAFLVWYIRQALQLMRIDRIQAVLYLALLYQQMVMNMSESEWFSRSDTFSVLILASLCLSRGLLEGPPAMQPLPGQRPFARPMPGIRRHTPQGIRLETVDDRSNDL